MINARTLAEAHLYINITLAGSDFAAEDVPDYERWTTTTQGAEAWAVRFDHDGKVIEVEVPYESEAEARDGGARFGVGLSEAIDAGQWQLISAGFARRVLADDLRYAAESGDRDLYDRIVLGWEMARDCAAEAVKFVPGGIDDAPSWAFWTEMGTAARDRDPARFSRAKLEDDVSFYQQNLDDFISLHA